MNMWKTTIASALMLAAALMVGGCTIRAEPVEPVPAGYTVEYDPVYYDRGWYDGPNWYWYGSNHRLYHESREWHERRWHDRYRR